MTLSSSADRLERAEARRARICELHEGGASFNEIAAQLGITATTARRLHHRAREVAQERAIGLSPRARRIVEECGHDAASLRRQLMRGADGVTRILRRRAACGPRQVAEIIAWLGEGG
ncbi:helix-turn-helix domain-containing protein [Sphingomonas colocasiae]|uniref:RNA polymerase sigma factor 70 region 4 type 2 domain-containing protein n=1 Tax=Sphingomonas colocasiae TaxID=1848973 RepID=A0ABS7PPF9_9SPHN|nr:helix-turn-helix domain-containing protein [Sphingomonas colocasiae]MBY8823209.1 hypothetical protein [Sphingomonas colocasiae]